MQEVNSLWEMLGRYFESDIVLTIVVLSLPWMIKSLSKKQKLFLGCAGIGLLLCFNDAVFWVMSRLGEGETYYRLLWILPLGCVFAAVIIMLWDKLKKRKQKVLYILVLAIGFFIYGSGNIDHWTEPDLYCLPKETMRIADMIDADAGNVPVNVFNYENALMGVRQYNANMILIDDTVDTSFDFMLRHNRGNVQGMIINAMVYNLKVEYICVEKEKNISRMALLSGGAELIGETENHCIYRFDSEEIEKMWNATNDLIIEKPVTGLEYATLSGVTEKSRFVYYADGHITTVKEALEPTGSYLTDKAEYQYVEFEEYIVCAIDNSGETVELQTVEQFRKLSEAGKPIILLLTAPISSEIFGDGEQEDARLIELEQEILKEDSLVEAVYTTGYHMTYKMLLENRIMECICIPTGAEMGVMINVKGK